MYDEIKSVESLLRSKNYNHAWKTIKALVLSQIEGGNHEELVSYLRKYMLFLNITGDSNQTTLFNNRLINLCIEYDLGLLEYAEQCRVLNEELDWYGDQYKQIVRELYDLHPMVALHVILAVFESLNQELLATTPTDAERIFYLSFVYGKEADFESGISALNSLLKLWQTGERSGLFRGRDFDIPYVPDSHTDFRSKLAPIVRAYHYLKWICNIVSLHKMDMSFENNEVVFTYSDLDEYRRFKLPLVRETARMQNAQRVLPKVAKQRFNWELEEIDYERIIRIKPSGDDFRLEIGADEFVNVLKRATEDAYQSHLLILDDMYIDNIHELKVDGYLVTELLVFYYYLKAMALIYFEATQYFTRTHKKEARAPYLMMRNTDLGNQSIDYFSQIFKRKITQKDIDKLIGLFTFGGHDIFDLYYKPLLVMGQHVAIIPSLFMMNNFPKTFLYNIRRLGVNLDERGSLFEEVTNERFTKAGFIVHDKPLPYSYVYDEKRQNGDIDLVARKDNYLFIGQLKNRFEPLEPRDYLSVDGKIRKGVYQAQQALLYIRRNPEDFCARIGIHREELDTLEIKPFVLLSCFYGSGQIIDGISVIDSSALIKFFEGELRVHPGEGEREPYTIAIREPGEVKAKDFLSFLDKPYFLNNEVYGLEMITRHIYQIRDRVFVVGVKGEEWQEHFSESLIARALAHFEKGNLLE